MSKQKDAAVPPKDAGQDAVPADYTATGQLFTDWFNARVRRLANATINLGTKTATAVKLHADGRLECSLHGEGGTEAPQFVAFDPNYLNQLLSRFSALDL
jgi:hypothetical protein